MLLELFREFLDFYRNFHKIFKFFQKFGTKLLILGITDFFRTFLDFFKSFFEICKMKLGRLKTQNFNIL